MSRMTCLIIFSGCSARSIRSLRLARTKVDTRSSNAIGDSFHDHVRTAAPLRFTQGRLSAVRPNEARRLTADSSLRSERQFVLLHGRDARAYIASRGGRIARPRKTYFPTPAPLLEGDKASGGFGPLSPIVLTLANSSLMLMPDSVSNNAGTCAAILVISPVILFIPDASPLPVETIVILSTFASGLASAFTTSGMLVNSLSITAAWLYSW